MNKIIYTGLLGFVLSACSGDGGDALDDPFTSPTPTGTIQPSVAPTITPTAEPSSEPTALPSPTIQPTVAPTVLPSPSVTPTVIPSTSITSVPTAIPSSTTTSMPTPTPTVTPTDSIGDYEPITGGCDGYATRFWDCCKPHCSWSGNIPEGVNTLPSCSANNTPISDITASSACEGGDAHTCYGLAPFSVSDKLAYGYAATASGDVCGRCFQLQFTGDSHNAPGDPGSAALAGKTMIIQAINIGYDVSNGQFDLLVPGGGVGAFNACSNQWGIPSNELGAQYGGLLAACKQDIGWNASLDEYKSCLVQRCNNVFGSRGLTEMQEACIWYADWFEAADNPKLKFKEVACPSALTSASGMDRGFLNDISESCSAF